MKNREIAERRAVNQIWNAAQDYSLQPVYVAFDEDGDADFYFNTVIGAVHSLLASSVFIPRSCK